MATQLVLPPYKYQPLDRNKREIRPIQFNTPVRSNDAPESERYVISCTATIASLDNVPEYWALSCTWGDNKLTHSLLLDGQILNVTSNLASALQHLAFFSGANIWIDAICT